MLVVLFLATYLVNFKKKVPVKGAATGNHEPKPSGKPRTHTLSQQFCFCDEHTPSL